MGHNVRMVGEPWTQAEVTTLGREYFAVLREERAGRSVNKNDALRRAQAAMPVERTIHTLKDRCYRISEELWKRDLPYVSGWRPPQLVGQNPNSVNVAATIWAAIETLMAPIEEAAPATASGPTIVDSQAFMIDAERRKAIEDLAQDRLTQHFTRLGWRVVDTHLTSPFDARASRGTEVRYLEAKGTTSQARAVLVTRGEVDWARAHQGQCVMGIVRDITFTSAGAIDPNSGTLRLVNWDPDQGELRAIQYEWEPPL